MVCQQAVSGCALVPARTLQNACSYMYSLQCLWVILSSIVYSGGWRLSECARRCVCGLIYNALAASSSIRSSTLSGSTSLGFAALSKGQLNSTRRQQMTRRSARKYNDYMHTLTTE